MFRNNPVLFTYLDTVLLAYNIVIPFPIDHFSQILFIPDNSDNCTVCPVILRLNAVPILLRTAHRKLIEHRGQNTVVIQYFRCLYCGLPSPYQPEDALHDSGGRRIDHQMGLFMWVLDIAVGCVAGYKIATLSPLPFGTSYLA